MRKPPSQTLFRWLKENGINLGPLTSHDAAALLAAVQIADLWIRGDPWNRKRSALAFNQVVLQMQPQTRFMAFHAIAHTADWCHRGELWAEAELNPLGSIPACRFGPQRAPAPIQGGAQ